MVLRDKKGLAFGFLLTPILIILFLLSLFVYINPLDQIKVDTDFGSVITKIDEIVMEKPATDFFRELEVENANKNLRKKVVQSLLLSSSPLGSKDQILDPEKLVICKVGDINLFYNQIGDDLSTNDTVYSNCLKEFGDIDSQYLDTYKRDLEESFDDVDVEIEIAADSENNSFVVLINDFSSKSSQFSQVSLDYSLELSVSIFSYSPLIDSLEKVIPILPDEFKKEVPICLSNSDFSEIECMENIFEDLIRESDFRVMQDYYFEIDFIEEVKEKTENRYFGILVNVFNKNEDVFEFNFGLILKDTIPYAPLKFEVEPSKSRNNFVNVKIEKPSFENEVNKYLVMYSYEDFLSTSHPENLEFIQILERGEIPTNMLTNTKLSDHNSNKYLYSNELSLTVILSNKGGFEQIDGEELNIKTVPVYQIFNTQAGKFELINKEVFVYVFALDENNNLFLDNIENSAKRVSPVENLGPIPPNEKNINLTGEIFDRESSLFLFVKNYQDSSFDHFDIYVLEQNSEFTKNCNDQDNGCYYFDGFGILTKDKFTDSGTLSYLITSMESIDFPNTIYTNQFSNNLVLENGGNYDVYVIAENRNNIGFYSAAAFKNLEVQDEGLNFQVLSGAQVQISPIKFDNVKVVDKNAQTLDEIEIIGWNLDQNNVYLEWKPKIEGSVKELSSNMIIKTNEGQTIGPTPIDIGLDGKVLSWKENYNRIELNTLQILDSNNNLFYIDDFQKIYPQVSLE